MSGRIPEISNERLAELAARIKPVVFVRYGKIGESGVLRYIGPISDLRGESFLWDPSLQEEAVGLIPVAEITTYHTFAFEGFFRPTIAEVLAQIPPKWVMDAIAFEIVEYPRSLEDMQKHPEMMRRGYHVATTRLYKKA
ncbi:hypothetical protein C5B42_05380 [Candidatus Cerribacteria bacterium 'Amazon FNV 2010 28 9']|uniref:Uncharacterized protein n=1 Tax=Candidatus Cerribacteria bacterium 'Amazon FNV 2010 28 9' TaxID=2081795 RepID=A0A317JME3_9BACT|nr:MAG: hypothetical protein C5B42_05380 [Candidatus Cerribacteria bacterium 'Amazon FNV 2010 28 9']